MVASGAEIEGVQRRMEGVMKVAREIEVVVKQTGRKHLKGVKELSVIFQLC